MTEHICTCGHKSFGHENGTDECLAIGCGCEKAVEQISTPTDQHAHETFDEDTLRKVYGALKDVMGLDHQFVVDAINALQNAGILFRERSPEPAPVDEHPAHRGREYGGGYARAAALAAGDPDWMNATGGSADEREALRRIISETENLTDDEGAWALPEDVADAILAAGFRRHLQPTEGEPSDAAVLEASLVFERVWDENIDNFDPERDDGITYIRTAMRAALRAARVADQEGENRG